MGGPKEHLAKQQAKPYATEEDPGGIQFTLRGLIRRKIIELRGLKILLGVLTDAELDQEDEHAVRAVLGTLKR